MGIKIKFNSIFLSIALLSLPRVYAYEDDMFGVFKQYVESNTKTSYNVEIVKEGDTLDDVINNKVKDKYSIAISIKDDISIENNNDSVLNNNSNSNNDSNNNSNNNSDSNSDDKKFYFAGTTDFRNLSTSRKDAILNGWSAIRESYSKYDDGGEDNVTIIATAYTSAAEENGGWAGMNAIGGKLGPGCIAAPKDIPFQTKIRISGLGVFNVEDRGGAIVRIDKNTIRIDVWMNSYKEAMHFGKRVYKGRIL